MVPFFGQVTLNWVGARLGSRYTRITWGAGETGDYGEGDCGEVDYGEGDHGEAQR